MTPEIILARTGIDVSTVEQGDEAWAKLRLGVITASDAHNVISKPRSGSKWTDMKMSYFHTLLAEVCTGVAPEVNAKALAWGKQYEEDARTLFEFTTDVKVTESPILFRDESMRTACSPDGLKREGIHHVVVELDPQYMSDFNEMVPEFIEKMDEALAEIGFTFGEQWK